MQVKRLRSDFIVDEVTALRPAPGRHALYQLRKSGLTTHDAIAQIARSWNLDREQISHAGLKDKHAETSQYLTIQAGPAINLELSNLSVEYIGQSPRAIRPVDIVANMFRISLRRLSREQAERMLAVATSPGLAIPNYFDNQRFGSLGESGEFIAHAWCLGNFERALFLALAERNSHDRPDDRAQKEILHQHWGDWATCKSLLARSHTRSVITYLVDHPTGFKKALALIRQDLRGIYVAAFQSKLWNELAAAYFRQQCGSSQSDDAWLKLAGRAGTLWMPTAATATQLDQWRPMRIPLPSGRKTEWPPGIEPLLDAVLEPFQMQRHQLRFSYPRDVFFGRGQRELLLRPQDIAAVVAEDELGGGESEPQVAHQLDDLNAAPQRNAARFYKLQLRFSLPAAQYATMLIKAVEAA